MDTTFSRNLDAISEVEQQRLHNATVAVIGCGGLGGFVIEELARLGVGRMLLCDPDTFSPSNRNRQLLALAETIGQSKARVAARRIRSIHPRLRAVPLNGRFEEHETALFTDAEAVVDCLDSLAARRRLATLCANHRLPLIHGAVTGWYGQVAVQPAGSSLLLDLLPATGREVASPAVLSFTVATVASIQAAETCKVLLGLDSPLQGNWMAVDLKAMTFEIISSGSRCHV